MVEYNPTNFYGTRYPKAQRFCFTLNNPDESFDEKVLFDDPELHIRYIVAGRETAPTTGTPHIQGFIIFNRQQYITRVRRIIHGAHIEIARSTNKTCADYCKKDGDYREFGSFATNQGTL